MEAGDVLAGGEAAQNSAIRRTSSGKSGAPTAAGSATNMSRLFMPDCFRSEVRLLGEVSAAVPPPASAPMNSQARLSPEPLCSPKARSAPIRSSVMYAPPGAHPGNIT